MRSIYFLLVLLLLNPFAAPAQWHQTNGPEGCTVLCFTVIDSTIFAGVQAGGILRSTDHGDSWIPVNNGLLDLNISTLATDGANLFAGTWNGGIFISDDKGMTWHVANKGLTNLDVSSIAIVTDYAGGNYIFAQTWNGLFRSSDNGNSWTDISLKDMRITDMAVIGENLFAAIDDLGVIRSNDYGITWAPAGLAGGYYMVLTALPDGMGGMNLLAGMTWGGIFCSKDNGVIWSQIDPGWSARLIYDFAAIDNYLFVGTEDGIFRTTDYGQSWSNLNNYLLEDVRALVVSGSNIFAGIYGGGIYRSNKSGLQWTTLHTGLPRSDVYTLLNVNHYLYAGTFGGGVFRSSDNGNNWTAVNTGLTNLGIRTLCANDTYLFAGTDAGGIFQSADAGASWKPINNGLGSYINNERRAYDQILSFAAHGASLFAGTNRGLFRSLDNGANWTPANAGLPDNVWIWSLAICGDNVFAGIHKLFSTIQGGIFRSSDDGASWIAIYNGLPLTSWVSAFAVSGTSLYAGFWSGNLFRSDDYGSTWKASNRGIPPWHAIFALTASGANLYAAVGDTGVLVSIDGGENWTAANLGLTNRDVRSLALSGTDLIAGTYGEGAWRRPLKEMTPFGEGPIEFILEQNYPNPFNSKTIIRFLIPNICHVRLTIFDVLGREVAILVDQQLTANVYEKPFDGSSLASGIYFARLDAGNVIKIKKLVLQK